MLDSEEQIIAQAVSGDSVAFGLLYDHYHPQIYRFVLVKVGRVHEAEDITHHVFLNAWVNIAGYKHRGFPFSSWLYRIARNAIIDHYRTAKQDVSLDDDVHLSFADIVSVDTVSAIDARLDFEKVRGAIKKLKPEYQDIIIMRFIEDMSIKDIATIIEKSEGAVKLLQHRAISQLKQLLS